MCNELPGWTEKGKALLAGRSRIQEYDRCSENPTYRSHTVPLAGNYQGQYTVRGLKVQSHDRGSRGENAQAQRGQQLDDQRSVRHKTLATESTTTITDMIVGPAAEWAGFGSNRARNGRTARMWGHVR